MKRLDLVRDILDTQVVDREGTKMGRVDGLVLEMREGQPPRIEAIEMGFVVLAQRLHPRLEDWFLRLRRRFSVRRTACYSVPWSQVKDVNAFCVQLDVEAAGTPAFDWERWLSDHVVAHLPGAAK
jgi:sporulation protein YlmC with PRC-barrel domain